MHFVLTNPLYTGVIVSKGESYEGKFQPLISRATFEAIQVKLKETELRLDKLINAFLNDTIEKSVYLQKKDELTKLKMELIQKKSNFRQKGKLWVEPLRHGLDTLQNAEKIISSPDFSKIKPFLETMGRCELEFRQAKQGCYVRQSERIWRSWWLFEYFFAVEKSIIKKVTKF